jgi:hypothetical protein
VGTYGGTGLEASQVKRFTGGNGDVVEGDGRARLLAGLCGRGRLEGTRATGLELGCGGSSDQRRAQERSHNRRFKEMHGEGMNYDGTENDQGLDQQRSLKERQGRTMLRG